MEVSRLPSLEARNCADRCCPMTSPVWKFLLTIDHFCHSWSNGRYSWVHLVQNKSGKYWTCFHLFLVYVSSLLKCQVVGLAFSSCKWLGVRGLMSFASSEMVVGGLPLMMLSTPHIIVWIQSSFIACSFIMEQMILRLSQTLPWWEAAELLHEYFHIFSSSGWISLFFFHVVHHCVTTHPHSPYRCNMLITSCVYSFFLIKLTTLHIFRMLLQP